MNATAGRILYETLKAHGVACLFGMEDPIQVFYAVDGAALARGLACRGPYLINELIDPEAAAPSMGFDRPIPLDTAR